VCVAEEEEILVTRGPVVQEELLKEYPYDKAAACNEGRAYHDA
jgi:hypothetical protein